MQTKQVVNAIAGAIACLLIVASAGAADTVAAGRDRRDESSRASVNPAASAPHRHRYSSAVREAQQALRQQGHDTGPVDGYLGPQTEAAVRDFQRSRGLPPSGRLDTQTLNALGVDAAGTRQAPGAPPSRRATK